MSTAIERLEQLPAIVRFLGTDDAGPGAICPHCGATGRYIVRFQVADGRELGAMRGCVQLFPVSALAREHARLIGKRDEYAKRGWRLNRADQQALNAIEDAIDGRCSDVTALSLVRAAKAQNINRARCVRR